MFGVLIKFQEAVHIIQKTHIGIFSQLSNFLTINLFLILFIFQRCFSLLPFHFVYHISNIYRLTMQCKRAQCSSSSWTALQQNYRLNVLRETYVANTNTYTFNLHYYVLCAYQHILYRLCTHYTAYILLRLWHLVLRDIVTLQ